MLDRACHWNRSVTQGNNPNLCFQFGSPTVARHLCRTSWESHHSLQVKWLLAIPRRCNPTHRRSLWSQRPLHSPGHWTSHQPGQSKSLFRCYWPSGLISFSQTDCISNTTTLRMLPTKTSTWRCFLLRALPFLVTSPREHRSHTGLEPSGLDQKNVVGATVALIFEGAFRVSSSINIIHRAYGVHSKAI